MAISDAELEALIQATPRALRNELIRSIQRLETALSMGSLPNCSWQEALSSYRRSRLVGGERGAIFFGLLEPLVIQFAKELDQCFHRVYSYNPKEYDTLQSRLFTKSQDQKKISEKAVEVRKRTKQERHEVHQKFVVEVLRDMHRDPLELSNSALCDMVTTAWQKKYPDDLKPPGRKVLAPIVKEALSK